VDDGKIIGALALFLTGGRGEEMEAVTGGRMLEMRTKRMRRRRMTEKRGGG
jgi:hypothetical protein